MALTGARRRCCCLLGRGPGACSRPAWRTVLACGCSPSLAAGRSWTWLLAAAPRQRSRSTAAPVAAGPAGRAGRRRRCWSPTPGRRRCAACVRDAWQPSAGADRQPAPARPAAPASRAGCATPLRPTRRGDRRADRVTVRSLGPARAGGPAAHPARCPGAVRVLPPFDVPQAPAEPAGPAARARRPGGGPGPRPGHRVRLAARVRARRRRPLASTGGPAPAAATSWSAPGGPSATGGCCSCSTPRAPRPAGSATCPASTPRWTPRCCSPRSPPGPATGSTSLAGDRRVRGPGRGRRARPTLLPALRRRDGRPRAGAGRGRLVAARRRPSAALGRQRALVVLLTAAGARRVEEGLLPVLPAADPATTGWSSRR